MNIKNTALLTLCCFVLMWGASADDDKNGDDEKYEHGEEDDKKGGKEYKGPSGEDGEDIEDSKEPVVNPRQNLINQTISNASQGIVNETAVNETRGLSGKQDAKKPFPSVQAQANVQAAKTGVIQDQATVPVQKNFLNIAFMVAIGLFISAVIVFISRK